MNYDLAKKLKDAGFPQEVKKDFWSLYYNENGEIEALAWLPDPLMGGILGQPKPAGYFYKIPELSELIEACGDRFHALENKTWQAKKLGATGEMWFAYSNEENDLGISAHIVKQGSTPEEAVANLWLALHPPIHNQDLP